MVDTADTIWRDFETDGIPASGTHEPRKAKIREWGAWVESLVNLAFTSSRVFATKAALDASLSHAANTPALVVGDPTAGNDGLYMKVGASGAGSWTQLLDFVPGAQFVRALDVGTGTPNALQATTNVALSPTGAQLVRLDVFEENTGTPVTVSFNGGTAYTIKTAAGNDVAAGGLTAGPVLGVISGSTFRLLSDQANAAIVAAAEAAQVAAELARDQAVAAASSVEPTTYESLAAIQLLSLSSAPSFLKTAGYASAGDGGGALYKNVGSSEPAHEGKFSITLDDAVTVVWYELAETTVTPQMFGAETSDSTNDAASKLQDAIDYLAAIGGGTLDGGNQEFLVEGADLANDYDNVFIEKIQLKRTGTTGAWILVFAKNNSTEGGGVRNVRLTGNPTDATGAGGILFGNGTNKANGFVAEDIVADSFAQYGVGVGPGDDWFINNIRILNHGLTSGTIASCMGFYIYPHTASEGGQCYNVYSEISAACQANANANTAAIKIQTHRKFVGSGFVAIGGREQCMVIDRIDGIVSDITYFPQSGRPGIAFQGYNATTATWANGQKYTVDGVKCPTALANIGIILSGAPDGQYSIDGVTIRNVECPLVQASFSTGTAMRHSVLENWTVGDIRLNHAAISSTPNTLRSKNNLFRNIHATGNGITGQLSLESDESIFVGLTNGNADDATGVGGMRISGNDNVIVGPAVFECAGNALAIDGDNNEVFNPAFMGITGRSIWFMTGADNNRVHGGNLYVGSGVLDNGSGNLVMGTKREFQGSAAPASGTWAVGDKVWSNLPSAGGSVGWVCTTAGTPGTWKTFGAIAA
jgi:hypothetical protein